MHKNIVELDKHIISDPKILGGKPIIKNTRISVDFILQLLASNMSVNDILKGYPHLTVEKILSAIKFAASYFTNERVVATK
jgi:uncharacterized protein (DUF433 family)